MADNELIDQNWQLHLTLDPTEDGRFVRVNLDMRKASQRLPIYMNSISSIDMLYEKVQGELNNALRQLVNDIHQVVVKPKQHNRR